MTDSDPQSRDRERSLLVAELAGYPADVDRLLDGQTVEALRRPASGGGWGVIEVLSHLLDWEEIYLWRLEAMLGQEQPDLPVYDGALWDIERDYRSRDPRVVLDRFAETRGKLVSLLAGLDGAGWDRTGNHANHGVITVEWFASHLRDHAREHLDQVREALA